MSNVLELAKKELPTLQALIKLNSQAGTDTATLAMQELEYLQNISIGMPALLQCIPDTVIMAIKKVLKQNLTLDPDAGLVYVKTRNVNMGNNNWAKVLEIMPTANGLISINRQCGRIMDVKRPTVTKDANGKVAAVTFHFQKPTFNDKRQPVATWVEETFDEDDFYRWRRASHKENARTWKQESGKPQPNSETLNYANENYTNFKGGIDPEFARAKAIRHGLKKLGTNQNENRAVQIVTTPIKNVVDDVADIKAAADDAGHEYAEYEETKPTTVHVTTHEEIQL